MAIENLNGIVFRAIPYSETSIILDVFTRQKGLHSFIISGVRKKKSKLNALLYKPITLINLVSYFSNSDKLFRIKEAKYDFVYKNILTDVVRSSIAMFMIDLCRNTIKEKEPNFELYDFIVDRFLQLDEFVDSPKDYHVTFCLDLSQYLGFNPLNNRDNEHEFFDLESGLFVADPTQLKHYLSREESLYLSSLLSKVDNSQNNFSKTVRDRTLDGMMVYYTLHLEGFKPLTSLSVLKTIFS